MQSLTRSSNYEKEVVIDTPPTIADRLSFKLFGMPHIWLKGSEVNGFATSKSRALLLYLAVENQPKSRDELASMLWPDMTNQKARKNLRGALYDLRKIVGNYIDSSNQVVAVVNDPKHSLHVDVNQFRVYFSNKVSEPTEDFRRMLRLYTGDFLQGFKVRNALPFDAWVEKEREFLRQLAIQQALSIIRIDISNRAYSEGLETITWLLGLSPTNEQAHYFKLQLLLESGEIGSARDHYQSYQELLVDYGMEPWTQIVDLIREAESQQASPESANPRLEKVVEPASKIIVKNRLGFDASLIYTTNFFGYQNELAIIHRTLEQTAAAYDYRLLTITGSSGVGKTRLAIEAGQRIASSTHIPQDFSDGIYFISFASTQSGGIGIGVRETEMDSPRLSAMDSIVATIADTLEVGFSGITSPKDQLISYLSDKSHLLILDNFDEMLLGAGLLIELLRSSPKLRLIVTSRERLNLYSEQIISLTGLSAGPNQGDENDRQPPDYASELFVDRVMRLRDSSNDTCLQPSPEEFKCIKHICKLTGGTPLAIEIAAALSSQMDLVNLINSLADDLQVLQFKDESLEKRHQSFPALLETTWQQLTNQEQKTLARLAVFQGGFSLDAAQTIAGVTANTLSELVNKSILRVSARYNIPPLIHRYVIQHLSNQRSLKSSHSEIQTRHQLFFQSYLSTHIEAWNKSHNPQSIVLLNLDYENIMAAWRWSLSESQPCEIVAFAKDLWQLAKQRGRLHEMIRVIEHALVQIDIGLAAPSHLVAQTSTGGRKRKSNATVAQAELQQLLSLTYYWLGDLQKSDTHGLEALQILGQRIPQSQSGLAFAFVCELGRTLYRRLTMPGKRHRRSYKRLTPPHWDNLSQPAIQTTQPMSMMGWIYNNLSQNGYLLNLMPEAALCALRAANLAEQTDDSELQTYSYATVSLLFGFLRLEGLKNTYLEFAQHSSMDTSARAARATISYMRGIDMISNGRCELARSLIEEALAEFKLSQEWRHAGDCLAMLNIIACHYGLHECGLAYGQELKNIASIAQNKEHSAWADLIQAVNFLQLDHASEALVHLEKVEPLYGELNFKDIGLFVGCSTRSLAHVRIGEYQEALSVAKHLTTLSSHNLPTSPIYLYVYHAVLEVFLRLLELAQTPESNESKSNQLQTNRHAVTRQSQASSKGEPTTLKAELNPNQLKRYVQRWLWKLKILSWIHPIGRQYLVLHQGRYHCLLGNIKRGNDLFNQGLMLSQRNGDQRNHARFHYEIGRYVRPEPQRQIEHLETALNIYQSLESPYGLKRIRSMLEQL